MSPREAKQAVEPAVTPARAAARAARGIVVAAEAAVAA